MRNMFGLVGKRIASLKDTIRILEMETVVLSDRAAAAERQALASESQAATFSAELRQERLHPPRDERSEFAKLLQGLAELLPRTAFLEPLLEHHSHIMGDMGRLRVPMFEMKDLHVLRFDDDAPREVLAPKNLVLHLVRVWVEKGGYEPHHGGAVHVAYNDGKHYQYYVAREACMHPGHLDHLERMIAHEFRTFITSDPPWKQAERRV